MQLPQVFKRTGVLFTGLVLAACGGGGERTTAAPAPPVTVATVQVTPPASTITVGDVTTLTAQATDSRGSPVTAPAVTWQSDAPTVASVADGRVTGVSAGNATISATIGGVVGRATVLVTRALAIRLEILPTDPTLLPGQTLALTVRAFAANGTPVTDGRVHWTMTNPAVVSIDTLHRVTALSPGVTTLQAAVDQATASVTVRVLTDAPLPRLVVASAPTVIRPGYPIAVSLRSLDGLADVPVPHDGPVSVSVADGATTALMGTTTGSMQRGEATLDDFALRTVGSYRLRFAAERLQGAEVDILVSTAALPPLVLGATTATLVQVGTPGVARYTHAVNVRDASNLPVTAPRLLRATMVRGTATIVSGDTATTANGTASFTLVVSASSSFDVHYSAAGTSGVTATYGNPGSGAATVVLLQRLNAADSVVAVGAPTSMGATLSSTTSNPFPTHQASFEVSWSPAGLALDADTPAVAGATYTFNRERLAEGVLRVSVVSATPLLGARSGTMRLLNFTMHPVAGSNGYQQVRITTLESRGPQGELLSPRQASTLTFRVP